MIVLRILGRFFMRIGRWIRDTAWVQPLLIVGGIFAIIFSIPHITGWVSGWFKKGNATDAFYSNCALSYSGIEKGKSEIDQLFTYMDEKEKPQASQNPDIINKGEKKFGKKFFLCFVQKDCADCEINYKGFKTLKANWGKNEFSFDEKYTKEDLRIYSIFIDKKDSSDKKKNLFKKWILETSTYDQIFEEVSLLDNPYKAKTNGYDSIHSKVDSFVSPTTFLVQFDNPSKPDNRVTWDTSFGVTEITFQFKGREGDKGSNSWNTARGIWDCWNHQGAFSEDGETYYLPSNI